MDDARLTEYERLTNDVRAAEEGNNPCGQNPRVMALCVGVANLVAEVRDLTAENVERLRQFNTAKDQRDAAEARAAYLTGKVGEWEESDRATLAWSARQHDRAEAAEARVDVLEAQQASVAGWIDDAPPGSAGLDLLRQIITPRPGGGS